MYCRPRITWGQFSANLLELEIQYIKENYYLLPYHMQMDKEILFSGYLLASIAISALVYTKHIFPKLRTEAVLQDFFGTRSHIIRNLQTKQKKKKKEKDVMMLLSM